MQTITARTVPALRLSGRDSSELRELGRQLKRELLAQYEEFVIRSKRQLDSASWKLEHTERDLCGYTEHATPRENTKNIATTKTGVEIRPQTAMAYVAGQPRVLVTGALVGSLEDAMFGASIQDTRSLQAFHASRQSPMEESAVVATLEHGSESDPFRFVGVTWCLQLTSTRVKRHYARDFLTLVESELTTLSNGEPVGVVLCHSIRHRDLGEMRDRRILRAKLSILTVFRPLDAQRVELWSLQVGHAQPGPAWGFRAQDSYAQQWLSDYTGVCYVGLHRKLRWLLQKRRRVSTDAWDAIEPTSSGDDCDACELCCRPGTLLFSRARRTCQLCYKQVCQRCSVALDLVVTTSKSKPMLERVAFCIECMVRTKAVPTKQVAQEELRFILTTDSVITTSPNH